MILNWKGERRKLMAFFRSVDSLMANFERSDHVYFSPSTNSQALIKHYCSSLSALFLLSISLRFPCERAQDLRCFGDAIFLRDLPRCAYLCHSAPHNRCVGWTIAPPPSPTTCCLKSWVSGEVHYAPNVVSGVEGLPKDVHLRLKGAQVGLARHESRLVNARVESGKNPYYRFADSVHLEDV